MDPTTLQWLQTGGGLAIACWVIYLSVGREKRTAETFDALNKSVADRDVRMIEAMTKLNANTEALHNEIRVRPCVQDGEQWNGRDRRHGREGA